MHPLSTTRQQSAAKFFLLALLVIACDQFSKWAVHTYMRPGGPGEIALVGSWFKLHYTTNPGMAFGAELPEPYGKLVLTSCRLLAVFGLIYYIWHLCRQRVTAGYITCMALILGGAVGNLIDSIAYGILYHQIDASGRPLSWLHGEVIDMLNVPIYRGYFPNSWPLVGGEYTGGFPIFNLADAAIFIGVALILLNQRRFFHQSQFGPAAEPGPAPFVLHQPLD